MRHSFLHYMDIHNIPARQQATGQGCLILNLLNRLNRIEPAYMPANFC